tara:strand:- start:7945 stop:8574 length:630 start_codon:yes stop_codon:yes gene_type:complete
MGISDIKIREVEIDKYAAFADAAAMLESYPGRGPAAAVYGLRPYIEDNVVCDLGCGGGDLVWLMGRWAKKAVGVEYDQRRFNTAAIHRSGVDNVSVENFDYFANPIPKADVYYYWPNDPTHAERLIETLKEQHAPTTLVMGSRISWIDHELAGKVFDYKNGNVRTPNFLSLLDKHGGEILSFSFREESSSKKPEWPDEDTWCLTVLTIE